MGWGRVGFGVWFGIIRVGSGLAEWLEMFYTELVGPHTLAARHYVTKAGAFVGAPAVFIFFFSLALLIFRSNIFLPGSHKKYRDHIDRGRRIFFFEINDRF